MPLTREQIIERAKARKVPPIKPRSRADAVLDGDALYTTKEAADILLMSRGAIRNAIQSDRIPSLSLWFMAVDDEDVKGSARRLRRTDVAIYMRRTNEVMTKEEYKAHNARMKTWGRILIARRRGRVNSPASTSNP